MEIEQETQQGKPPGWQKIVTLPNGCKIQTKCSAERAHAVSVAELRRGGMIFGQHSVDVDGKPQPGLDCQMTAQEPASDRSRESIKISRPD